MGNLCNQQPKNPLAWQRQPDTPFNKDKSPFVGRTPVVIKENIVLSPWDDGCLLLYGEAPGWCGMEAAITDTGDIHLLNGGTTHHYVINISDMIKNDLWFVDLGPAPTGYVEEEKETENKSKEKEEEASGSAQ